MSREHSTSAAPAAWGARTTRTPSSTIADGFAGLLFGFFVGEGEKDIDVGVGEEIFAAIAAEGEEGGILRRQVSKGTTPHFNEDAVDDGGAAADGGGAVARALTGLADKCHLLEILLPKIVNC